jgi:hypothetical protein
MFEPLESRWLMSSGVEQPALAAHAATVQPAIHASAAKARDVAPGNPLGGNLQGQSESIEDHAFVDLIKVVSGFKSLRGTSVKTDPNGWPTQDFTVMVWDTSIVNVPVDAGRFNMSFTGPASTHVSLFPATASTRRPKITKVGYDAKTGTNRYVIDVPAGTPKLGFSFTGTGGRVKNLKVLQPGYSPVNTPVYTTKYINFLKSLNPYELRFMDFTHTNNNPVANWANRSKPTDANMSTKGVAWEYVIQLANTVHTNVWINVPGHATDDYILQLATMFKNQLAPDLLIYVEYANEVWAISWDQGRSNLQAALDEVKAGAASGHPSDLNYDNRPVNPAQTMADTQDAWDWGDRRTARRTKQISDIFAQAWTSAGLPSPINNRVRVILGGQGPVLARFDNMLNYVNTIFGAPKNYFYGLGIAPYWGMNLYQDQVTLDGKTWTTLNPSLTPEDVVHGMDLSVTHYEAGVFANTLTHAAPWGLKLEAYEGGVNTRGPFNVQAKKVAQLDPRIEDLQIRYLHAWYSQGGDIMSWYRLGQSSFDMSSGPYSITDNLNNLNEPKEQGFRIIRNSG